MVIVGGALATARAGAPLALALAASGLQGVTVDRRGRGDSGDIAPYEPAREVDDLRAVIDALGEPAVTFGHSAGAVLSWVAASRGVPMTRTKTRFCSSSETTSVCRRQLWNSSASP